MAYSNNNVTKYALIAAFGGFIFGLDFMNISGAIRYISSLFELDDLQTGRVVGIGFLGVVGALLFVGTLCERFGRQRVLLAIALAYSLSSILSAFALSYEMLVVGRLIGGAAFASITVSAMYIGEIATPDKRGKFVSVNQLMIALGVFLASAINFFLIKYLDDIRLLNAENVWRFMLGAELIFNAVWVALVFRLPESPRWLLKKGREQEARAVLEKTVPPEQVDSTIKEVVESFHQQSSSNTFTQLKRLFSKRMTLVLSIAIVYAVVQGGTGMNAILSFAPMIFEQVGMSTEDGFMQTVIMSVVNLAAVFIAIFFVEKLGRRFLTLAGLILVVVAHLSSWVGFKDSDYHLDELAMQSISQELQGKGIDLAKLEPMLGQSYQNDVELKAALAQHLSKKELPLATGAVINHSIDGVKPALVLFGIFAIIAAFNMSIGPILWVILSEIFPNNVRSVALPFAAMVQTLSSWAISELFPWKLNTFGAANVFLLYAVIAVVGFALMYMLLPETKGKSLETIEKDLVPA
ncbi:sugar porter family MFS transporter [Agaribacterium haliotis]|uniref:sugar porter family MFS transporter n=1 Tax=Agaribacterium haliotis TaxID=2013869 RepID=UPI000BB5908C|nr:sugar porter family MFS transporter [Agaribacterium haliotis]